MSFNVDPDLEDHDVAPWQVGQDLRAVRVFDHKTPPFFSFIYMVYSKGDRFTFNTNEIDIEEYRQLFKLLKIIGSTNCCDLDENKVLEEYNFKINNEIDITIRNILKKISGAKTIKSEQEPVVGHFHLYDSERRNSEKEKGGKCPVIHFCVGLHSIFYILCYDSHHSIHK